MWVCERHRNENHEALESFKDEYQKNHKLTLGLYTTPIHLPAVGRNKKREVDTPTDNLVKPEKKSKPSIFEASENDGKNAIQKPVNGHKNISTGEGTRKLRKKLNSSGEDVELRPIPEGRAQFMIGQTKGKTRPLNILYDSGCYGLLLKEGVQKELGKSVLKTKGPFEVNGVGNTSVKVNDEWITTLKLIDGSRQVVEGWTVEEVTAPLPKIDVSRAVKDIKDDKPDDNKLKSMLVHLVVGGESDILLDLMYNAIFPMVFTLSPMVSLFINSRSFLMTTRLTVSLVVPMKVSSSWHSRLVVLTSYSLSCCKLSIIISLLVLLLSAEH